MSAVDFVDNPTDLMYVGTYLSQVGLPQRALQIYRQAAALDPIRPEPYMLGLRAARTADDLDGLKWASLGILGQAWPKQQDSIWQAGVGVANEVLDRLRAGGRTKEADQFLAALEQAVARDCVAVVTWTGEGDIDVMVEEPSGTVCSLRNPRTTAGGLMLGDAIRQTGRDSFGGHSEVYVCPKGFDGALPDAGAARVGQRHRGKSERGSHYSLPYAQVHRRPQADCARTRTKRRSCSS